MLETEPPRSAVPGRYDAAFKDLAARLSAVARRVLGDATEAEDVVQEAFLRLASDPVLDRPADEITAWLQRVTLNLAFNRLRDTRRWHARAEKGGRLHAQSAPDDPLHAVLRNEQQERVRAVLAQLPDKQRDCLLLRHSGYSYAEIAATVCVAPGSVGTTLARAERAFRALHEES